MMMMRMMITTTDAMHPTDVTLPPTDAILVPTDVILAPIDIILSSLDVLLAPMDSTLDGAISLTMVVLNILSVLVTIVENNNNMGVTMTAYTKYCACLPYVAIVIYTSSYTSVKMNEC